LRLRASKNELGRNNSIEVVETHENNEKKIVDKYIRPLSKKKFVAKNKVNIKVKLLENKVFKVYFRNQLVSMMGVLNRRDDYFNLLKGKRLDTLMPMKTQEVD